MNETQKRIKAYQAALPKLRERIVAMALLLAMSLSMMTTASLAWLTISRSPEVTGVNTTIAANGNLEIALAKPDGSVPLESLVGDSMAREGQSVAAANVTWGNLVNLSDPAYGLENLVLRPARLNSASLLKNPLYGAMYGWDGRITQLSPNFAYTTWIQDKGRFEVSDLCGVRAISSTVISTDDIERGYWDMVSRVETKNLNAGMAYSGIANDKAKMQSLASMMGLYMTARMNPSHETLSNPTCEASDIKNLAGMYSLFLNAMDLEAEALAELVNLQLFLKYGDGYTPYDKDMIYATSTAELKAEGLQITRLDELIKDRNTIDADLKKLETLGSSGGSLAWKDSGLNNIVNNLVDVGKCTIGADNTPISSIGASNAANYLKGTQEAKITNGVLYRFEERTGSYLEVKELEISATVSRTVMGMPVTIPATVKANVSTTAPRDTYLFLEDLNYAKSQNTGNYEGGVAVAEDTYGLAIDLWVRTNALNSFLTLEGNILTETKTVPAMGKDSEGSDVALYTVTVSGEEGGETVSYSFDVYKKEDASGNETWYQADNHTELTEQDMGGADPLPKMVEERNVIGYEGENRIWGDEKELSVDSTSQGSGSCYVYYADTPEDQMRSLRLLEAFRIVFVDDKGKQLATALMDTANNYAVNGRVIVPLKLDPADSVNIGADVNGVDQFAITALEKNKATRITAIVYLNGQQLTNDQVLAAADIQGQLNIQFGSGTSMKAIGNEKLEGDTRTVTASVSDSEFDYDTDPGLTTRVTVRVDTASGEQPAAVTAFFLRAISDTQGSRETEMTFTYDEGAGCWTSDYTFTTPGKYTLRTVRLDGVDYTLAEPCNVTVKGFAIKDLYYTEHESTHVRIMTADRSEQLSMNLEFAATDQKRMPTTVQGRFIRSDGSAVNINFNKSGGGNVWTGKATFLSSGEYSLKHLVLDGEYTQLEDESLWHTATVYLGMKSTVYTTSPQEFLYRGTGMAEKEKLLGMQVLIMDDTGKELGGQKNVKLTYGMQGSGIETMDTNLTWNGSFYEGELATEGPGIWEFRNVMVGENTITYATDSPVFTIMSPEPPAYHSHSTSEIQYVLEGNTTAKMSLSVKNSSAASIKAHIVNAAGTIDKWVDGVRGEVNESTGANTWTFEVPKDANGYQDGNWTLTELAVSNVFDQDGNHYTVDNPMVIDLTDKNIITKVVNRVFLTFDSNKSKDFGKDASGKVTGGFATEYTISGLGMQIKDFEGLAVPNIKNVQMTFSHVTGTDSSYGYYSGVTAATAGATITVPLEQQADGTTFLQKDDATIVFAGKYNTTISFGLGLGQTEKTVTYSSAAGTLPGNAPVFTVSSIKPTVAITAISPTGTYNVDKTDNCESDSTNCSGDVTSDKNTHVDNGATSSYTSVSANVYFKCARGNTLKGNHNYTRPSVTITLYNKGNASQAELSFGSDKHVYNGTTKTGSYVWSANGACARNIGYYSSSNAGTDQKTSAGTITANTLVMTYDGQPYNVSIDTITINNPY